MDRGDIQTAKTEKDVEEIGGREGRGKRKENEAIDTPDTKKISPEPMGTALQCEKNMDELGSLLTE